MRCLPQVRAGAFLPIGIESLRFQLACSFCIDIWRLRVWWDISSQAMFDLPTVLVGLIETNCFGDHMHEQLSGRDHPMATVSP
jgi:hypothetical protein